MLSTSEKLSFLRPLWALLKKHLVERIRCYPRTICELFSAVAIYSILILLEIVLAEEYAQTTALVSSRSSDAEDVVVLFTPNNRFTAMLMKYVCVENSAFALMHFNILCFGFANKTAMFNHVRSLQVFDLIAVILFEDVFKKIPANLKYTIMYAGKKENQIFYFKDLYNDEPTIVPNITLYSNLQWAIDKMYLEHLSGEPVDHKVHMVEQRPAFITKEKRIVQSFLVMCSIMAALPYFLYSASRFMHETRSGIKSLIRVYGVSSNIIRLSHLLDTFIFSILYSVLVTIVLKVSRDIPILPYSNAFLMALHTTLHLMCVSGLAFVLSAVTQDARHADSVVLLTYVLTFLLNTWWFSVLDNLSWKVLILSSFIPHAPIFLFWDEITFLEGKGVGLRFKNLFYEPIQGHVAVFLAWTFLIIQFFILYLLTWYLDYVMPGKYGIPLKWNFCFEKNFWKTTKIVRKKRKKKRTVNFHVTAEKPTGRKDNRFFEVDPIDSEVAIKISQVTKVFHGLRHSTTALDNIDLDIYRGEITMLLGVNGAGKSTLLSIIAGMNSPTSGTVYVNGLDTSTRIQEISKDVGFCPQNNVTFNFLTVRENIVFFERLRGKGMGTSAEMYMDKLDLTPKADLHSDQIDAGRKRCLQVACALVGDAEVLVLDEPTSNMDSNLRHALWDCLLLLRGEKTIFIATTVMEEADALGDRIALLSHGKVKCHGSPAFLKDAIGADFKLNVTMKTHRKPSNAHQIVKVLEDVIPDTTTSMTHSKQDLSKLSICLPAKARDMFPKVFDALEYRRHELGISSISVGVSMEEVFLRFVEEDDSEIGIYDEEQLDHYENMDAVTSYTLWLQQMITLMGRTWAFVRTNKVKFLILQVIIPFLGLMVVTLSSNNATGYGNVYSPTPLKVCPFVLYHPGPFRSSDVLVPLKKKYPETIFVFTHDLPHDFRNLVNIRVTQEVRDVYGYSIESKRTVIYYPNPSHRTLSRAMNTFSNIYMSLIMPYAPDYGINVSHVPLKEILRNDHGHWEPKKVFLCNAWATWVSFLITTTLPHFILLAVQEYYTGVRFRHMTAGCSSFIIWYSKMAIHLSIYSLVIPPSLLFAARVLDADETISRPDFLVILCFKIRVWESKATKWNFLNKISGAIFIFLLAFGPACLMHLYALSFLLNPEHIIAQINIMTLFLSTLTPMINSFRYNILWIQAISYIANGLMKLSPACILTTGIGKLALTARANAYCSHNYENCDNIFVSDIGITDEECCNSSTPTRALAYYTKRTGLWEILSFVAQFMFYSSLVMLMQTRILQRTIDKLINIAYKEPPPFRRGKNIGFDVAEEKTFVREKFAYFKSLPVEERQDDPVVFLAQNLHKRCRSMFSKLGYQCCDVKGVNFAVRNGEVFGMIGQAGSGKSTVVNMLSGFTVMTKGDCYLDGYFLNSEKNKYLRELTFSTRLEETDEFLTGYENVKLLAKLHGHSPKAAEQLALLYLQYMGLQMYTHVRVSSYTPGCARRLGMAGVLATASRLVLLDSPTANVDTYMRPLISRAIQRLKERNCIVIMAEHSMPWRETEQICSRLALIVRGQFVAIESVYRLRTKFASGFIATIKLKIDSAYFVFGDENETETNTLSNTSVVAATGASIVKREFMEIFPTSKLKDEHLSMLYFRIEDENNSLLYSEMFMKLEQLRAKFSDIIEDYTLSQTSIEQVIETLASEQ